MQTNASARPALNKRPKIDSYVCLIFLPFVSKTNFYPSAASQSHLLPQLLMEGGCISIPQRLYSIHGQTYGLGAKAHPLPRPAADPSSPVSHARQNGELHFVDTVTVEAAVRHVDSSSLSEDDVFYN